MIMYRNKNLRMCVYVYVLSEEKLVVVQKRTNYWNAAKEYLSEQYANRIVVFLDITDASFQSG